MKIASISQVLAALGEFVRCASGIKGINLTTEEVEYLRKDPVAAMMFLRDCRREWERRRVIPESTDTNPESTFSLARIIAAPWDFEALASLESFAGIGNFDDLLRDYDFRKSMLDQCLPTIGVIDYKIMTTSRLGFVDHVPNEIFMKNDFLHDWSRKHYRGHTLELCDQVDICDTFRECGELLEKGSLKSDRFYVFATKPGRHRTGARFLTGLTTYDGKPTLRCVSWHDSLTLVTEIVFRVTKVAL